MRMKTLGVAVAGALLSLGAASGAWAHHSFAAEFDSSQPVTIEGTVPNAIWLVLFLGAVLTISFTFFFGTQNVITQSLMTGVLAALIFSAILVVIAIDRPFTGAVVVSQESIQTVLQEFEAHP